MQKVLTVLGAMFLMVLAVSAAAQQRAADGVTINDEGNPVYSTFSLCAIDPVTGQSFTDHSAEVYAGWCNAAKGMDAWGAQNASFGNLWKATAEINESLYPHIQWSRDYRTDSGGPGQWRGLCGSHYEKEVRVDAKVYTYVVGMKYPMPGICGGEPGAPNRMVIRYGSDDEFVVRHGYCFSPSSAFLRSSWTGLSPSQMRSSAR